MYVEDDEGNRIVCPHPVEYHTVTEVLGENPSEELVRERTGFNSYCICLDCLHKFMADLGDERSVWRHYYGTEREKDKRECPQCSSSKVRTVFELIGEKCPKCKTGTIEEIDTGIIS